MQKTLPPISSLIFLCVFFLMPGAGLAQVKKKPFKATPKNELNAIPMTRLADTAMTFKWGRTISRKQIGLFAASPDWKAVVYTKSLNWAHKGDTGALCAIQRVSWRFKKSKTVLDTAQSVKYAVHGTYPIDLKWISGDSVSVSLADGDVDGNSLIINASSAKIISEQPMDLLDDQLTNVQNTRLNLLAASFKKYSREALTNMIRNNAFDLGDGQIIGQINFQGYDNDILLFDTKKKIVRSVLALGNNKDFRNGLRDALRVGSRAVMVLESQRGNVKILRVGLATNSIEVIGILEKANPKPIKSKAFDENSGIFWLEFEDDPISAYYYKSEFMQHLKLDPSIRSMELHPSKNRCLLLKHQGSKWKLTRTKYKIVPKR